MMRLCQSLRWWHDRSILEIDVEIGTLSRPFHDVLALLSPLSYRGAPWLSANGLNKLQEGKVNTGHQLNVYHWWTTYIPPSNHHCQYYAECPCSRTMPDVSFGHPEHSEWQLLC